MDTRAWRPYVEESASGRVLVRHPRLLERTALEVESLREPSGHVLSLEQIMAIRASNDYTEPPSALCPNKALHWTSAAKPPMRRSDPRPTLPGPKPVPPPALPPPLPPTRGSTSTCPPPPPLPRRSASGGSTASRTSDGSLGSERRLLSPLHNRSDAVICGQPGPWTGKAMEASDGAHKDGRSHGSCLHANRVKVDGDWTKHALMCEKCGLCKCDECTAPRTLPTCWLCEKRCLCSAESTLEYATCLCCIKALFYHCMDYGDGDSSDSWADKPCAGCSQSHCALRWGCMALASLCLPCLPCYLPGRCCLKACLSAYERVGAPRCRCPNSNTVCRRPPEIPPRKPI